MLYKVELQINTVLKIITEVSGGEDKEVRTSERKNKYKNKVKMPHRNNFAKQGMRINGRKTTFKA